MAPLATAVIAPWRSIGLAHAPCGSTFFTWWYTDKSQGSGMDTPLFALQSLFSDKSHVIEYMPLGFKLMSSFNSIQSPISFFEGQTVSEMMWHSDSWRRIAPNHGCNLVWGIMGSIWISLFYPCLQWMLKVKSGKKWICSTRTRFPSNARQGPAVPSETWCQGRSEYQHSNIAFGACLKVALYCAGFPCTPFSYLHFDSSLLDDGEAKQFYETVRRVKFLEPCVTC